ncbi:MAG: hypothetical protein Athens041674_863 [Parcubacteria group bacterium Athens0416_74]|nr:MAG: hypothetical protein Athens041674_863 [Parcubacteria group bacterium Athens0416_74]
MPSELVRSVSAARELAESKARRNLPVFPAKLWAEGHGPEKEPLIVLDMDFLLSGVHACLYVSQEEHGKNGAEIEWAS